jgi:hypothetical protein
MGLEEEFKKGRDWIAENFDINSAVSSFISNKVLYTGNDKYMSTVSIDNSC